MAGERVRTPDAVVFLPGIMGSQLSDSAGNVVWGMRPGLVFRQLGIGDVLKRLEFEPGASDDGVLPTGILRWPVKLPLLGGIEPYAEITRRLEKTVEDPSALLLFPYDWRRSIATAASLLRPAAATHLANWRKRRAELGLPPADVRLTFVCHSLGGLVSRYAAEVEGDPLRGDVRRIITLGTPHRGSVKALRILTTGEYLPFRLLARDLRDAARTLPGLYELLARNSCVSDGTGARRLTPDDLQSVGADHGRAAAAFETLDRLRAAVLAAGAGAIEVRPMVGMRQPTLQGVRFAGGETVFEESLGGVDYSGDGTVYRGSAAPAGTQPGYLPQSHGAIAKSPEALTFVESVLTEEALGPLESEPTGVGVRVPEAVAPGRQFEIEMSAAPGFPTCRIEDTDTNRQVAAPRVEQRDGRLVASVALPTPGLYRVRVFGGGLSPVEELVPVIDPSAGGRSVA